MSFTVMLRGERMAYKGTHSMRRPNMAVKLPVRPVTVRACARPAPGRPAAYGRR